MQTMTLQEIASRNPEGSAAEIGKLLDELDEIPRRKKRRYDLALPGTQHVRLVDSDDFICPYCAFGDSRGLNKQSNACHNMR